MALRLRELVKALNKALEGVNEKHNPEVEVHFGDEILHITAVHQFQIVPDVSLKVFRS